MSRPARSLLFVPGTRPDLMGKADRGSADEVVLDWEDAVPVPAKPAARESSTRWLREPRRAPAWVRVNSGAMLHDDLEALAPVRDRIEGVLLAKAGDTGAIADAAALGTPIGLFLETAAAVLDVRSLVSLPGVQVVHLGEADLAADAGLDPGPDEQELAWARSQVVLACAAAGLRPPPAPVSVDVADMAGYRVSTERARRQGFVGRACIHPRQVTVANQVFTPAADVVQRARELLLRYDAQVDRDTGAALVDGRMIDEAVLRSARRVLALAASRAEPGDA